MKRVLCLFALAAAAHVAPAGPRPAASAACRPFDAYADTLVGTLQALATSTDSGDVAQRNRLGIPATAAASVTYVTTEQVCSKAATAFAANVGVSNGPPVSGVLYVVKVANVYVVDDPSQKMGEFSIRMVLTDKFKYLSQFM
jgi:hypothetical protein